MALDLKYNMNSIGGRKMYEVRSKLKLVIPASVNFKTVKKYINSQNVILVEETDFESLKKNIHNAEELMIAFSNVNLCSEVYSLIKPMYDYETGDISFYEDYDGIPSGYHIRLISVATTTMGREWRCGSLFKFVLEKDAPAPEPVEVKAPAKKKSTKAPAKKKSTSTKTKTTSRRKTK